MKKIIAIIAALFALPANAQNYLRDDGIFHSVVEGMTTDAPLFSDGSVLSSGLISSTWSTFVQFGTGAATRTAQDKMRDAVNVKDFGAVCDGVTDDGPAAQLAHNTGRPVIYPAGTCYIATKVTLNGSSVPNFGIIGQGSRKTILKQKYAPMPSGTDPTNNVSYTMFDLVNMLQVSIEDVGVNGQGVYSAFAVTTTLSDLQSPFKIYDSYNVTLKSLDFTGVKSPVYDIVIPASNATLTPQFVGGQFFIGTVTAAGCRNIVIQDVRLRYPTYVEGGFVMNCEHIRVDRFLSFADDSSTGVNDLTAVTPLHIFGPLTSDVKITNSYIKDHTGSAMNLAASNLTVDKNTVIGPTLLTQAMPGFTKLINTTSGLATATITSGSPCVNVATGQKVTGSGIPAGPTTVADCVGTTLTLSANATATATGVTATFGAGTGPTDQVRFGGGIDSGDELSYSLFTDQVPITDVSMTNNYVTGVRDICVNVGDSSAAVGTYNYSSVKIENNTCNDSPAAYNGFGITGVSISNNISTNARAYAQAFNGFFSRPVGGTGLQIYNSNNTVQVGNTVIGGTPVSYAGLTAGALYGINNLSINTSLVSDNVVKDFTINSVILRTQTTNTDTDIRIIGNSFHGTPTTALVAGESGLLLVRAEISGNTLGGIPLTTAQTSVFVTNLDSVPIGGTTGSEALRAVPVASQVNRVNATGATTGNMPSLLAAGSDTNVDVTIGGQGSGGVRVADLTTAGVVQNSVTTGRLTSTPSLGVSKGGTNCTAASGTCLDNITGFSSTGYMQRTGAGTYTFSAAVPSSAITVGTTTISSGTSNGVLTNSAGVLANTAAGTNGQLFLGVTSGQPVFATMSGDATISNAGVLTINPNAITLAKLATQATNTVLGNATSGTAVPTALAVGTCSTAASALIWTTNTGFGCNTSITAAAVPASGLTGTTLASNVVTSSLTTVGTIGTGVWQGTKVGVAYGGTNADLSATGGASQVLTQFSTGGNIVVTSLSFGNIGGSVSPSQMPAFTGDITTVAGAVATTLATVASAGTTGSSTAIPVITINAKGLTTGITTAAVVAPAGTVTGTTLASNVVTSSLTSVGALAGGSATTGFTIAASNVTWTGTVPIANLPVGTSAAKGIVQCDGTTITCTAGVIAAVGGAATSIDSGGATTAVTNGATNTLLYNLGGFVSKITAANSSVLITSGAGAPSWSTTLPSGLSATSLTLVTPALGTPASGVVTNLTGTASININGTVGATTPGTGAFTTLTASGATTITNATASTSPTTGALIVTGGIGTANSVQIGSAGVASSSRLGVTYTSASELGMTIQTSNSSTTGGLAAFRDSAGATAGSITWLAAQAGVAFNTASDKRLKTNERDIADPRAVIMSTKIWDFEWKKSGHRGVGVFAQDAYLVFPDAVTKPDNPNDTWQVDYSKYVPHLIAHNQSLQREVDELKLRLKKVN